MHKLALLTAAGVLFVGAPLRAQAFAVAPGDSNAIILDIIVDPTVHEPYRVFLARRVVYHASFSQPGVSIRMRSYEGKQLPYAVPVTQIDEASGRSEIEIYPQSDGEIEFLPVFNDARVPVHFLLWQDARATARGRRSAEEGFWEIGIEAFGAYYAPSSVDGASTGESGSSLGGCFSFRNGPGVLGRLNGCAFGMEVASGEGDAMERTRFFIEPRYRLIGGGSGHSGWATDAGILFSVGATEDVTNLGPGIYGALDYRNPEGEGWRFLTSLRTDHSTVDMYRDITQPELGTRKVDVWTPSLRFGAGYYW